MNTRTKSQTNPTALIRESIARTTVLEREGRRVEREGAKIAGEARTERAQLEEALRAMGGRIRGTRDVTVEATAATNVGTKVELALRASRRPLSVADLAGKLREPAAKVEAALAKLAGTRCATASDQAPDAMAIFNHGNDSAPRWSWVVGDAVDTEVLYAEIEAMLRRRPYTFAELSAATGARRGRISGATVQFARTDLPVWNVSGSDRKYRWFVGDVKSLRAEDRRGAKRVRLDQDKNKL